MKRSPDTYRDCAQRGLSKSETARALGVSVQCVDDMAARHGMSFRDGRKPMIKDQPCGTSPSGLWTAFASTVTQTVTVYAPKHAPHWRYRLQANGTLDDFTDLAYTFAVEATAKDLRWLGDFLASVEQRLRDKPSH